MLEIFVAGDIERAIKKLRARFSKEIYKDFERHVAFESRGERRRRKIRQSIRRRRKSEALALLPLNRRRSRNGKSKTGLDSFRSNPVKTQF